MSAHPGLILPGQAWYNAWAWKLPAYVPCAAKTKECPQKNAGDGRSMKAETGLGGGKNRSSLWAKALPYGLLLLVYGAIHLILRPNYGDDLYFRETLNGTSLLPWLGMRYASWSSRLITEAILVLLLQIPVLLWFALDMAMTLLLYTSLKRLLAPEASLRESLLLALLLCCYPYSHMGSAGWITTTVMYWWPLSTAAWALSGMARSLRGEAVPWYRCVLYALGALYGCGNELAAVMLLAASLAGLAYAVTQRRGAAFPLINAALSLGGILFALTAPGNAQRLAAETATWMPDFVKMSLLDKLRMGFVSTFEHFVSIPNAVLFLLTLLTCLQAFLGSKDWKKRAIGLAPLLIQVAYSAYFFAEKVLITKDFTFSQPELWPSGAGAVLFQAMLAAAFLAMIVCLAASLYWNLADKRSFWLILAALGAGLATRMSLAFSPTVLASGTRTYLFLYMALIAAAFSLWRTGLPRRLEAVCLGTAALGVAYSIVDVFVRQSLHP